MSVTCPSCGNTEPAGSRFCGNCGQSLAATRADGAKTQADTQQTTGWQVAPEGREEVQTRVEQTGVAPPTRAEPFPPPPPPTRAEPLPPAPSTRVEPLPYTAEPPRQENNRPLLMTVIAIAAVLAVAAIGAGVYFLFLRDSSEAPAAAPVETVTVQTVGTTPHVTTQPVGPTSTQSPQTPSGYAIAQYIVNMHLLLNDSYNTFQGVSDLSAQAGRGGYSWAQADDFAQQFVNDRRNLIASVRRMAAPPGFAYSKRLLIRSLQLSLADDVALLQWVRAHERGASGTAEIQRVNAIGRRASVAKRRFLSVYRIAAVRATGDNPPVPPNY